MHEQKVLEQPRDNSLPTTRLYNSDQDFEVSSTTDHAPHYNIP